MGAAVTEISPEQEEIDALHRIARSADGPLLRRYLRRVVESCRATVDAGDLQRHEGGRIMARNLMVHMDQADARSGNTDEPILHPSARAGVEHAPRGIKRRVYADPSVATYLHDPDRYGDPAASA